MTKTLMTRVLSGWSTLWAAAPSLVVLALVLTACGSVRAGDKGDDGWTEAVGGGVQGSVQGENARSESTPAVSRSVRTVRAKKGTLTVSRSASVTIEPAQESYVSASTTAQVKRILAREGSRVGAGQTVVQLDDEDARLERGNAQLALETARIDLHSATRSSTAAAEQARASLQPAATNLASARRAFRAGERLFAAGGISKTTLDGLQLAFEQAESTYVQAQEALAASQHLPTEDLERLQLRVRQAQTQLLQAERGTERARLVAPFAGEVAEVLVEEGEFVATGSPVFRLVGDGPQLAHFSVPPGDVAALSAQKTIWIDYGGLDYAAQIVRFSGTSEQTRLVAVVAELYGSSTRIPTGTVTEFSYELELASGVVLPAGAVRSRAGRTTALVVKDGRVAERPLQLRAESGARVVVAGLGVGSEVIYPAPDDLSPGTPVRTVEGS